MPEELPSEEEVERHRRTAAMMRPGDRVIERNDALRLLGALGRLLADRRRRHGQPPDDR